eukprot:2731082-Pleurochrysis_carterae.AAC.1
MATHVQRRVRHFDRTRPYANAAGTCCRTFLCTCSSRLLQSVHTVSSRLALACRAYLQLRYGAGRRGGDWTSNALDTRERRAD